MLPMLKRSRLLLVAALAAAVSANALAKDKPEPFVAAAQISEQLGPPGDACQPSAEHPGPTASGTINGTGLSNVVGAFTVKSSDCIRSNVQGQFFPPFTFSSDTFTLTAANGADTIVATYGGNAELNPLGLLVLTGTYTIIRGTGQFLNARGSGTLAGVEAISTEPNVPARGFVTLTGQITIPR